MSVLTDEHYTVLNSRYCISFHKSACSVISVSCGIAGSRRLQRFLQSLQVTAHKAHYDLLLAIAEQKPRLAAGYLSAGATPFSLEPRPGLRWWAGMSLVGRLVKHASQLPLPFLQLAQRYSLAILSKSK